LNVFLVNIAGGEPTTHPEFSRIIAELVKEDMHFILTTNGVMDAKKIEAIVTSRSHLLGVKISLDGPTALSHAALRYGVNNLPHTGSFDAAMAVASRMKDADIPFTLSTCLHESNIELMKEMSELVMGLRPHGWFLSGIAPSGRANDNFSSLYVDPLAYYSHSFWDDLKGNHERNGTYIRYIDIDVTKRVAGKLPRFSCPAATEFCEIASDGLVSPCPVARVGIPPEVLRFENVRSKPLKEIWNGPTFAAFGLWRGSGCDGCTELERCDRCVAQSVQCWGDPSLPPPQCVRRGEELGLTGYQTLQARILARNH
jgi:MoaA/NifB/PqqE/SkfB family radical SAM enzyme